MLVNRLVAEHPDQSLFLVGVSLGGNVLLKYLGEQGTDLPLQIKAAVGVSVPFDLERASRHIDRGFAKIYQRHFVRSLKRKALIKLEKFPDLIDRDQLATLHTMYALDDAMTAPIHGFRDARHYYSSSSSIGFLERISIPTLLLSAVDDPFLPPAVLDDVRAIADRNDHLHLEFTKHGGHVGFVEGRNPFRPRYYAERRAVEFLAHHAGRGVRLPSEDIHRGNHAEARV
jgi:predicted alpha/beta-fold hydrolase